LQKERTVQRYRANPLCTAEAFTLHERALMGHIALEKAWRA